MKQPWRGMLTVTGRFLLSLIFLMSAVGNKIPNFSEVVSAMSSEGVPAPRLLLTGAIGFLIAGGLSVILGYRARSGALLLLVFLVLATYYFHDFWTFEDVAEQKQQMIQFMKNLALMGALLLIVANGAGPYSVDDRVDHQTAETT